MNVRCVVRVGVLALVSVLAACAGGEGTAKQTARSDSGMDSQVVKGDPDANVQGPAETMDSGMALRDAGGLETGADSGSGDAGAQGAGLDVVAFCERLRDIARAGKCEASMSTQDCDALLDAQYGAPRCAALIEAVKAGRIVDNPEALGRCLATATDERLRAVVFSGYLDCPDGFSGQVPDRDACYDGYGFASECEEGHYCAGIGACPGTCRALRKAGESCGDELRWCLPGHYCHRECTTPPCRGDGICQPLPTVGEPCGVFSEHQCAFALRCDTTSEPSTCVTLRPVGEACTANILCETFSCLEGVCAEATPSKCQERADCDTGFTCQFTEQGALDCLPALAEGARCLDGYDTCAVGLSCLYSPMNNVSECRASKGVDGDPCSLWGCEEDHYCAVEGQDQICRPDRAQGESCMDQSLDQPETNPPCQPGLHCMLSNGGLCLPPGGAGEPCYYNDIASCQADLICLGYVGSTCQPPVGLTELCNPAFEETCLEGYCACELADSSCTFTCTPTVANGEPCEQDSACTSGHCGDDQGGALCVDPADPLEPPAQTICVYRE